MSENFNNLIGDKVDRIIVALNPEMSSESVKQNLLAATYIDLQNKVIDKLGDKFDSSVLSVKVGESTEDALSFQANLETLISESSLNFEEEFRSSLLAVFEDFVSELRSSLPQEKIEVLNNVLIAS